MAFQLPDSNQLKRLAGELNLVLDEQKTRVLLGYMQPFAAAYEFIDKPLREYDLLLMPTTVATAAENPTSQQHARDDEIMHTAFGNTLNTCQFNATGHPAISIPCGRIDGLPVGLMLVGRHYAEKTIYRAAHAFEQSVD